MKFSLILKRLEKLSQVVQSKKFFSTLVFNHVLAGTEHRHVLDPNLKTVVDIGANRGQFALAVREWVPKARIIAFEPLTEAATVFRNVFRGDTAVTLHRTAIGPQEGETIIHVAAADDSSSLLPISHLQKQLFPGTGEIRTEIVRIGSLSTYVMPEEIVFPALLKIDVQGYELEVLRGCEELLCRFSHVYVECSFVELYHGQAMADDIIAWFQGLSWCLSGVYNMTYDCKGRSVQSDFLFENSRSRHSA